jgi:histidinol phosphatase-like PHP family hydrolase
MDTITNAHVAELSARAAEEESGHRRVALRRAGRAAMFSWSEEAATVAASGRSLTELSNVGPWVARRIHEWIEHPPDPDSIGPPEIRRGFLTRAEALTTVAANPEWQPALRADLQMHTTHSDGSVSIAEMAGHCASRGYEFAAITDHSKSLRIAKGMDETRLAAQGVEIGEVNAALGDAGERLRLLRAIEMDLDVDGRGDMDPAALADLDLVLGAFHTKLRLEEDQTERYVKALRNSNVHVMAHPRARKYDRRLGLRAEWSRVIETAAETNRALEIDASPDRQDLPVELLELVREAGGRVSIGSDAHAPVELDFIPWGLAAAIRARIPRERILNFAPVEDVLAWASSIRESP